MTAAGSACLSAGGEPGPAVGYTVAFIAVLAIPVHVARLGASWLNWALVFRMRKEDVYPCGH